MDQIKKIVVKKLKHSKFFIIKLKMNVTYHEFFNYFENLKVVIEMYVENKYELQSEDLHENFLIRGHIINRKIVELIKKDLDFLQRSYLLEELVPMYMNHDGYDYCEKKTDYYIQKFLHNYILLIRNIGIETQNI